MALYARGGRQPGRDEPDARRGWYRSDAQDNWHLPLRGVLNLVGKTTARELLALIYHSAGVVCPITFAMHVAAAFDKPAVVVAGGREQTHWYHYPSRHISINSIGDGGCCLANGCQKGKCHVPPGGHDANPCPLPIMTSAGVNIPACMNRIQPSRVIEAIEHHLAGQPATSFTDRHPYSPPFDHGIYPAQHGEDRWMEEHWDEMNLPERGTFVEVGASNGFNGSNTFWLERTRGWSGLLLEPDPRWSIVGRPGSIIERVVCGPQGVASFAQHVDRTLSGVLSSGERVDLPSMPLTLLLEKHKIDSIDVLSIDTEGTELDVWGTLDLSRWRPQLVIIEWNTIGLPDRRDEIASRMTFDGYAQAAVLGGNMIFWDAYAQ